jgi:hypothetical protein
MPESIERQVSNAEKEITRSIQKGVKKTVRLVKKRLKQVNTKTVNRLVYRKYNPMFYIRRKNNGGLSDPKNITFDTPTYELNHQNFTVNCILQFHNITRPNPIKYLPFMNPFKDTEHNGFYKTAFLSSMIEHGYGLVQYPWNKPRAFMDNKKEKGIKQTIEDELSDTRLTLGYQLQNLCFDEIKKLSGMTIK